MKSYFTLFAVCLSVYFGCAWLNLPTSGLWFYVEMSSWSFLVCAAAYYLSGTRAAVMVGVLELVAININLISAIQESTTPGLIWLNYDHIISTIAILELAALIIGAPWHGIRRMVREHWGHIHNFRPAYLRDYLGSKASSRKWLSP